MEDLPDEISSINHVLDTYFQGIYEGCIGKLYNIYHPQTLLFGDIKGQPYAKTLVLYLSGIAHRQSPKDSGRAFKGEVISVSVINSIAFAKVRVRIYELNYLEFLSFHKIDNRWLIVNKMITEVAE